MTTRPFYSGNGVWTQQGNDGDADNGAVGTARVFPHSNGVGLSTAASWLAPTRLAGAARGAATCVRGNIPGHSLDQVRANGFSITFGSMASGCLSRTNVNDWTRTKSTGTFRKSGSPAPTDHRAMIFPARGSGLERHFDRLAKQL
jgi:hypothetical protein